MRHCKLGLLSPVNTNHVFIEKIFDLSSSFDVSSRQARLEYNLQNYSFAEDDESRGVKRKHEDEEGDDAQ